MFAKFKELFQDKEKPDKKKKVEMTIEQEVELLKKVTSPIEERELPIDISALEKTIKDKIPKALGSNAPANFPDLYYEFTYTYSKLYDFILFQELIGKNVVALGGGFSSGKSSFLNAMLGDAKILPTSIKPSTSVPAYVIKGKEDSASAINTFSAKIKLDFDDIRAIAHGFGKKSGGEITLGHLLRSLFIATPVQPYPNIAFLDTPGYSKPDNANYSAKTDEKIAHSQLNNSDYILWFISADAGTIKDEDLNFLARLDKTIPKLIILNKIDKVPDKNSLDEMKTQTATRLDVKGIRYEGILTYTRKDNAECDRKQIKEYLQKLDHGRTEYDFAYKFKELFTACKDYYGNMLDESKRQLSKLNHVRTLTDNEEINDALFDLSAKTKGNIADLQEARDRLQAIQQEFFTEIKAVADKAHIRMPEPSEIELLGDKIVDPLSVMDNW